MRSSEGLWFWQGHQGEGGRLSPAGMAYAWDTARLPLKEQDKLGVGQEGSRAHLPETRGAEVLTCEGGRTLAESWLPHQPGEQH